MTKDQKNEVIELLKSKFSQYNNFYITDTESLSVAQVGTLRRHCFDKQVKALTQIKTKNEMIGEVIGLLQSPAKRVIAALLNRAEKENTTAAPVEAAAE